MGIVWHTHVAITPARVNDAAAANRVLDWYDSWLPLKITDGGFGRPATFALGEPEDLWPSAVPVEALPDEDGFTAVAEVHERLGQQGLNDLLLALAPFLDSPLTVQAASFSQTGDFEKAKEWTVRPRATAVEIKEIVALGCA